MPSLLLTAGSSVKSSKVYPRALSSLVLINSKTDKSTSAKFKKRKKEKEKSAATERGMKSKMQAAFKDAAVHA